MVYNQITPLPDKLLCENTDNYAETIALIESLSDQLEKIKLNLNQELTTNGDETYKSISAGFPTDEELKKVEKLSEAEQQAYWEKIEANQSQLDNAIADNSLKFQAEKERLNKQVADYQNELLAIVEELSEIHYEATKIKSDKRQKIYNTFIENNTLTEAGKQQIDKISAEFCSVVSPALLKKLRLEYDHLKNNMALYRRLTVIELMEFSTLTEEVVSAQNAALLDLNDLEMLAQFLTNYRNLFNFLPGEFDNQTYEIF
ncbi:hypothetical protein [Marinilabilia sp.]|uniref:hypothetical protein n=1 Tax=Marinilabilia sp. TaxID=2021252 RepID=UPI0025C44A0E|nr:hypothetical protein [Marinilabilia sp.]